MAAEPPASPIEDAVQEPSLRLAHAFGVYPEAVHGAVISLGDDAFLFLVGRQIAIFDQTTRRVSFLPRDTRGRTVTAAARSASGRLLAVAERVGGDEEVAQHTEISVLSLPRLDGTGREEPKTEPLKVLSPSRSRQDIMCLAFTGDAKFLVSLSAMPDCTITYWRWEVDKVMSQHDIKPTMGVVPRRLQVNPMNGCQLSVSGSKYMRLWEYNPNDLKLTEKASMFPGMNQEKAMNIVDHCWVQGGAFLCAATDDGQVHLFEDGEHREVIDVRAVITKDESTGPKAEQREQAKMLEKMLGSAAPGMSEAPPVRLTSLAPWGRGFVVGGDQGYLGVFKVDARLQVEGQGTFRMPGEKAALWTMSAGSEDTHLTILSYEEKEVEEGVVPSGRASPRPASKRSQPNKGGGGSSRRATSRTAISETTTSPSPPKERLWSLHTFPLGQCDLATSGQMEVFSPVFPLGAHHGAITAMSSSSSRRVLATCGVDHHLKVWGYPSKATQDQPNVFTSELNIKVATYEKPSALAVHPLGFQVAVIIEDLLRVYHLTTPQVTRTHYDLALRHPGDVAYSTGGHMLAVSSVNDVILMDPWRLTLVHLFTGRGGHTSPVTGVLFSEDDRMLLSCAAAPTGAIYGWDLDSPTKDRRFESVSKGTSYTCMVHDFRRELVVACTQQGHLRVVEHLGSTPLEAPHEPRGCGYTALLLAMPLGLLIAGTKQGCVRLFRWPLESGASSFVHLTELSLHAHGVSSLALSRDSRLLFSGCEGGAVISSFVEVGEIAPPSEEELYKRQVEFRFREDAEALAVLKRHKVDKEVEEKIALLRTKLAAAAQSISATVATLDDLVMVPRAYFQDLLAEIRGLEDRMEGLKRESEYAMDQKEQEIQEKLETIQAERKYEKRNHEEKYEALLGQLRKTNDQHDTATAQANSQNENRMRRMQEQSESERQQESEKESELLRELRDNEAEHEEAMRRVEEQHEAQINELRETHERALAQWRFEYDKVCDLLKSDGLKFEEAIGQQESEYEGQITEMIEHKRIALQAESERSTAALKDGVSMKNTISMLQKKLVEKDGDLAAAEKAREDLKGRLKAFQDMFAQMEKKLAERERGMKVKDESLSKLREQMKHLESFRFVLFHKVKALEEERDPLEEQVSKLKGSVREMYNEFVREFREKQKINQQHTDKSSMATHLQTENVELRAHLTQLKKDGRRLLQEVEQVLHADSTKEFEHMPKRLLGVVEKHQKLKAWAPPVHDDDAPPDLQPDSEEAQKQQAPDAMLVQEVRVQRDALLRKYQMATGVGRQAKRECAQEARRLTAENATLIAEMNTLRNERKKWQRSAKELESNLISLKASSKHLGGGGDGGGLAHAFSAPDLGGSGGSSGSGHSGAMRPGNQPRASGAAADTPYMRRKVVDKEEVYRRQRTRQAHQLPPVPQPGQGPPGSGSGGRGHSPPGRFKQSAQEKRFSQNLESMRDSRRQMEQQGFTIQRLSDQAQAMTALLERPPRTLAEEGEPGSFANAEGIQT